MKVYDMTAPPKLKAKHLDRPLLDACSIGSRPSMLMDGTWAKLKK